MAKRQSQSWLWLGLCSSHYMPPWKNPSKITQFRQINLFITTFEAGHKNKPIYQKLFSLVFLFFGVRKPFLTTSEMPHNGKFLLWQAGHSNLFRFCRFSPVCPQRLPDIHNETAALERMPKGRLEYLKRLLPYLQNQSEDCLYLNIYVPIQGECGGGGAGVLLANTK